MKKIIFIVMLAIFAIFASNFSEAASLTGDQMANEILGKQPKTFDSKTAQAGSSRGNQMASEILGSQKAAQVSAAPQISEEGIAKRVFKKLSTLLTQKDSETAKAVKDLKTEVQKKDTETAKAVKDLKTEVQKKDTETAKAVANSGNEIIAAGNGNTALVLVVIIVGILCIAALVFFGITSKKKKPVTAADLDEAKKDIIFAINDIPTETVRLSREVDPMPFEFDVAGHHVVYKSPIEGIREGYYRTLKVLETPDGPDHPEIFERQAEVKRGLTLNYVRGTLKKFLEGKLQGTNEEKLIVYLRDTTKEIKIS